MPSVHLRYQGESYEIDMQELDVGDLSSDREVKAACARYFDKPEGNFDSLQVDRNNESGDMTVRPPAVFG